MKLAARLSALYAVLLGVTVLIVILASSIALVFELWQFSGDIMIAKHEEARILVDQYHREGMTLSEAAPEIVNALSGIGLRVTVFDLKGHYLAGDKSLRPKVLTAVLAAGGMQRFIPPSLHGSPQFHPPRPNAARTTPADLRPGRLCRIWSVYPACARLARAVLANSPDDRFGGNCALLARWAALRATSAAADQRGQRFAPSFGRWRLHATALRHGRRR